MILTDCCSSQTEEIQQANLADMERVLMDSAAFADFGPDTVPDTSSMIRTEMLQAENPEPFGAFPGGGVGWPDRW